MDRIGLVGIHGVGREDYYEQDERDEPSVLEADVLAAAEQRSRSASLRMDANVFLC